MTVLAAVLSVVAQPLPADERSFLADLAGGHVSSYVVVATGDTRVPGALGLPSHDGGADSDHDLIWVTDGGLMYRATLSSLNGATGDGPASAPADVRRSIAATAAAAGQPVPPVHPGHYLREWGAWLSTAVLLVMLVWLLTGPQPRRFTRWGWFWILGTGLACALAILLAEAPFNRRMDELPEPAPHQTGLTGGGGARRGGWTGLLVSVIAGTLLGSLVIGVGSVVERHTPVASQLEWHAVTVDGTRLTVDA